MDNNLLLVMILICGAVVLVMVKQINLITSKIDKKEQNPNDIYAKFSAFIQDKIRQIRQDISNQNQNAIFVLKDQNTQEEALEFLANTIRKLVFFETMNGKNKNKKEIESGLFNILSSLDEFIVSKMQNGEDVADKLKDEFALKFSQLQQ